MTDLCRRLCVRLPFAALLALGGALALGLVYGIHAAASGRSGMSTGTLGIATTHPAAPRGAVSGDRIAFGSREGLYVVWPDGGGLRQLTAG